MAAIIPIVEGHAEQQSVPVLLRRIRDGLGAYDVNVAKPFRVKRTLVVREGELERAITQAVRSRPNPGAVLLLLDADDDCPAKLGPRLAERAREATDLPVAVVLANREFEAWFLGGKESLAGVRGIRADARAPDDPEAIRDAKGRVSANMRDRGYLGPDDQPALCASLDLELASRRCPSLQRLVREAKQLIGLLS